MATVLDYSAGKPGAAAIKSAGHAGAVRYIGIPGHRKNTTAAELEDFTRAGLGMALVFEAGSGNWRGGRAQGAYDGQLARSHARSIGFPDSRPIYMAIDQDVVTVADFGNVDAYLRGAAGPLGGAAVAGVYGEYDVCVRASATSPANQVSAATWFWQCRAWSGSKLFPRRHLFQRVGSVTVGGIACDINDVLQQDWGQHNAKEIDMLPDERDALMTILRQVRAPSTWQVQDGWLAGALSNTNTMLPKIQATLVSLHAGDISQEDALARLEQASRDGAQKAVTESVLPAVEQLRTLLDQDNAAEAKATVDELIKRLTNTSTTQGA